MEEILVCRDCPCRPENVEICIRAGYKNGNKFGDNLRRQIVAAKLNKDNK